MQKFNEFIDKPYKKIIVGTSLGDLDSLIKLYSVEEKKTFSNFERKTILELSKSIFYYVNKADECIENEILSFIFYNFLESKRDYTNHIYGLIPEKSFNYETVKICLKTINEIRKSKKITSFIDIKIDTLIKDFESYLLQNNKVDNILLIKKADEYLKSLDKNEIENILGLHCDYEFGLLKEEDETQLSYIEAIFLNNLVNKLSKSLNQVEPFEINNNLKIESYKTYGFYQEVENVVKIINEKKLRIQDTVIVVSDNKYNNSLKAYLENCKIPYYFTNGENIKCFDRYGLLESIIDFFVSHYSITALYDIYRNKCINKKFTNIAKIRDLRATKEQILFVASKWTADQQTFIKDLLNVYDKNLSISNLYKNIILFINKYVSDDIDALVKETLEEKINIFMLLDNIKGLNYFKTIKNILDNTKIDVKRNEQPYLEISSLSSASFLFKKHIFLIGLSSSQINIHEIESPLVSDENLAKMIDSKNYFVNLATEQNIRFNKKLERLIQYNKCENINMSYSCYDSSEFRNLTESIFYSNHVFKEPITPNLSIGVEFNEFPDNSPLIGDEIKFNDLKRLTNLTPTKLDDIYTCPLKYIYSNYYERIELDEYEPLWLLGKEKGNFVHKILQEYFTLHPDKVVDEESFYKIFNKVKEESILEHPFDNEKIIEKFCKRYENVLLHYIKQTSKDGFRVLCCEKDFDNVGIKFNGKDYVFDGRIDRIDYKIDTSKIIINVIDYKTGHKKTIDKSGLTQTFIYTYAIKHLIDNDVFKDTFNNSNEFQFHFHYIYLDEDKMDVYEPEDKVVGYQAKNEEQLRLFDSLENNITSYLKIYKPKLTTESKHNTSSCTYCTFYKYCALKRNKSFNKSR